MFKELPVRPLAYVLALLSPLAFISTAHADDYGCKVLLCMANPNGPTAENECKPPIERFLREQAKKPPEKKPTCEEAQPATMRFGLRGFDACPADTSALGQGIPAIQLTPAVYKSMTTANPQGNRLEIFQPLTLPPGIVIQTGIGEGQGIGFLDGQAMKTCVAKPLGTLTVNLEGSESSTSLSVFEKIVTMAPPLSPRVLDIFINDQLYRSTRY